MVLWRSLVPRGSCLARSVTPGVLGGDVPSRPRGERMGVHILAVELASSLPPAPVSPKRYPGLEESGGPQRAAPWDVVRGGEPGAARFSRLQGLTPTARHVGKGGINKPGQKSSRGLGMGTSGQRKGSPPGTRHLHLWAPLLSRLSTRRQVPCDPASLQWSFPVVRPGLRHVPVPWEHAGAGPPTSAARPRPWVGRGGAQE